MCEPVQSINCETINSLNDDLKDPFSYLERDEFTSEKYKIEIRGLPKYYGVSELKKFLNEKLQLQTNKVKPPKKGASWLYVCFRNEESRKLAIEKINGLKWKQSILKAQAASPAPDPFLKRKIEEKEEARNKRMKNNLEEDKLSPGERIKFSTIPIHNMSYNDQLAFKQNEMRNIVLKLGVEIAKVNKDLKPWFDKQKALHNGLICELQPIAHADKIDGYRNKCEFTIGKDESGNRMIGFRLSTYVAGSTAIGPIDDLIHIPQQMKVAIKILEKFVKTSDLEVFNAVDQTGYWRQATVRITSLNHIMLIIGVQPQNMSIEEKENLKSDLKEFFENEENSEAGITSLYFQTIGKKATGGEGGGSIEHITGSIYIEEEILGMKFRISPEAFFQINTLGAEVLYKTAIELAKPMTDTALLDVCCGTGTIGLCFSKYCEEVFGIDVVENAIKDAKENAKENNVKNSEFFIGKAEDILLPVMQRTVKSKLLAIVDPPRAGLHQKALIALRKAKKLNKLVYISCDPKAITKNLIDFARPNSKQFFGDPLIPVKAVPVDMFPHTKHCELVICLERFSNLSNI